MERLQSISEPTVPRLGGLERRVMEHLWADTTGERWFTVREGRANLYRAMSSRGTMTADLMREALDGASATGRVTALTRFVEAACPAEVAVLRRALNAVRS